MSSCSGGSNKDENPRVFPIRIPPRLLEAFRTLKADPVLVGGSAVQVWTGRSDDIFQTFDLDFITHLQIRDLSQVGIDPEETGRHVVVDGVAVEFPTGPLAIGDLYLDPKLDSILVLTTAGDQVRCLRPEACVLDRLAQVAAWKVSAAYLQASVIVVAQSDSPAWDQEWIDQNAVKAGLGRQWEHLKIELEYPSPAGMRKALELGWDMS